MTRKPISIDDPKDDSLGAGSSSSMSTRPSHRRGEITEPWADAEEYSSTSAFDSFLDPGTGKRKRKKNKRSKRGRRKYNGNALNTSSNSGGGETVDSTALKRTLKSMEDSTGRLEEKKRHLSQIVNAVSSAAEKAAISAELTPLKLTQQTLDLDSEYGGISPDIPPPPYNLVFGQDLALGQKTLQPGGDLFVYPVVQERSRS